MLRRIGLFCGPAAGGLIAGGVWLEIGGRRPAVGGALLAAGIVLAVVGSIGLTWGRLRSRQRAGGAPSVALDWRVLRIIVGGANVPTTSMRVNVTWPLAVLDLGEARFRLRVRGARLFGARNIEAGPTEVKDVYPVQGRLGASGVGFTDQAGRDYYFWTSAGAEILYGLSFYGFPVSQPVRPADKAWTTTP